MKFLKIANTVALLIPVAVLMAGFWNEVFIVYAFVSTMVTGFIQVCLAVVYWSMFPKSKAILVYFLGTGLFFFLWLANVTDDWYWWLPFPLCMYLSVLIYRTRKPIGTDKI